MHGAIGNLDDLYDYASVEYGTVFGEYEAGHVWLAMDPTNGFRIMLYDKRTFQANPSGVTSFGAENETEIEIDPSAQTIAFKSVARSLATLVSPAHWSWITIVVLRLLLSFLALSWILVVAAPILAP